MSPVATTQILLWRIGAALALLVGLAGVVLPVVPTVPFLIVAAWAGSKGWPALEQWLLDHSTFGPHIRRWRERGSVPRRAKWLASLMMLASAVGIQLTSIALWIRVGVPMIMLAVAVWLWRRPES